VSLLRLLLEAEAGQEGREVWMQEVLALLEPAARQSRAVARYLATEIGIVCRLVITSMEPLSLSLGKLSWTPPPHHHQLGPGIPRKIFRLIYDINRNEFILSSK
jgi:hypothetical protein